MDNSIKYSKEAMDILGKVPGPIIRYGLLAFLLVLGSVVLCLIMIKYPDSVEIPVKMSSYSPNIFFSEIAEDNLDKIKVGQKVSVSLNEYPENNYGTWEGIIKCISSSPNVIFYQVKIEISPYSVSTKGNKLPSVSHVIWGTAKYKGDDKSFFQRIFIDSW